MPLNNIRTYLAVLALAALSAGSASAATAYTSLSSWAAALTGGAYAEADQFLSQDLGNPVLNFDTYGQFLAWGSAVGTNNATFTTLTVNGVTLDSAQNPTLNIASPAGGNNASLLWLGANALGSGQFSSEPLTIQLTDVNGATTSFILTTGASAPAFWGFTSGTAINTITISAPSGYDADLMDFYAGTDTSGSSTTECATLLMVGSGLVILGARRKYFRPQAA